MTYEVNESTQNHRFAVGDIVHWSTPAGSKDVLIIEVWNDPELPRLLVTDLNRTSMETKPVLQCDCVIVTKGNGQMLQHYIKPIVKASRKRLLDSVEISPNDE